MVGLDFGKECGDIIKVIGVGGGGGNGVKEM